MPVPSESTSVCNYYNFDRTNTTLVLHSCTSKPSDNVKLTAGFGGSTNFNGVNAFVLEGKAQYSFNDNFSAQLRSRNSFSTRSTTFQQRVTAEYSTPVSDNVSVYVDPYVSAKYNCHQKKFSLDEGVFVGAKYKVDDKWSVCAEVQKYDGFAGGAKNWGFNTIITYNL